MTKDIMFFDKTCNVYTIGYTKVWWSSKRAKTSLYSWIECNFEVKKRDIQNTELWKNDDILEYEVIVPIKYNSIRNNQNVELIDDTLWTIWTFIVSDIQSFKSLSGWVDCIMFIAKELQWQL